MTLPLSLRLAARDLRGGLAAFRVFLACLALGVAAIAAVGTVRAAIEAGLVAQGAAILGGEAELEFTYRLPTAEERAWADSVAGAVSQVVTFRSMAVAGTGAAEVRALTEVKGVDAAYPLKGAVQLEGGGDLAAALAGTGGLPGAVMERVLAEQLGLAPGGRFRLGTRDFALTAILSREPDSAAAGFSFAPRLIVKTDDLQGASLLQPGTLFDSALRLSLPPGTDLDGLKARAEARFAEAGLRWRDHRAPAPGIARFVDRLGAFLTLVGLAGLAVGGVGVASAVRAWVEGRIATLATLRTLGAGSGLIFRVFLAQVLAMAALGTLAGLALGGGLPVVFAGPLTALLPFPAQIAPAPQALAEAGFFGLTSALIFALLPLARAAHTRAAALYRPGSGRGGLGLWTGLALVALVGLLLGGAILSTGDARLTLGLALGVVLAMAALSLAALGLARAAARAARARALRGRVPLRSALASLGAPGAGTVQTVLALGLGLAVLSAVGQLDANLRAAIARDLPARAPSFFFVDIQPDQIDRFRAGMTANPAVTRLQTAPMLRGTLLRINGEEARKVAGDHWVVRGDRGISFAATPPEGTEITAGHWWPADLTGPAQISFAATEAAEIGLHLGDRITLSVLGREIEAQVTSFRAVDFSDASMGFVMILNPAAVAGAPHSHIATVYAAPEAEAAILRQTGRDFPNVTAISVKSAVARVTEALTAINRAVVLAALVSLATGFVVLIGAAAAGTPARRQEAAVMKVLGQSRARIALGFALRFGLQGAAAGLVAVVAGSLAAWAALHFVMELPFAPAPGAALAIIAGGIAAVTLAGLAFLRAPLAARPAGVLRASE